MPPRSLLPFLLAFLILRLVFWFATFPNPDEAYYWLWGQHLEWSYYDHPPFQAWVQGVFSILFGRSNFVLRLPNLISNGIFFYTYYQISRYFYDRNAQQHFWVLVLLVLASPLYFLFLALAWHDHWLITFSLVAAYQFIRFADGYLANGKGESWRLYGAAGAIALAILCKYNAIFVGLGLIAAIVGNKRLRSLLRDSRIYFAGAIALSALIPILLWNISNDFQSFRYYVDRSVNTGSFSLKIGSFLNFVLFSFLTFSPVNAIAFFRSLRKPLHNFQKKSVFYSTALWIFGISTATLTAISLISAALYYWNINAYLLLFPVIAAFFLKSPSPDVRAGLSEQPLEQARSVKPAPTSPDTRHPTPDTPIPFSHKRLFLTGQFLGLLFATLLVVHYSILPVSTLFSKQEDPDSRMLFGWNDVATAVTAESSQLKNSPFIAATDYRTASALAYELNNKTVMAISDRVDQFDFWYTSDADFKGRDAIILADDWHPVLPELLTQFEQVSEPVIVPVTRFGVWIKNYYVIKGYHFKGGRVS